MFTFYRLYTSRNMDIVGAYCGLTIRGSKCHYDVDGRLHRTDGPAYISDNAYKKVALIPYAWYLNGTELSFEGFIKQTPISKEEKTLLTLKYS